MHASRLITALRLIALVVAVWGQASPASAQTSTVEVGKAFRVSADHDGLNTAGYRVKLDGVAQSDVLMGTVLAAGVVTVPVNAITARGAHTAILCAFNADGVESCSTALALTATAPKPNAPTNPRLALLLALLGGLFGLVLVR